MKKGSMSMGAVVLLVIGLVAGVFIIGGMLQPSVNNFENSANEGNTWAADNTSNATCVANCRQENPGNRENFISCRETRGCAP